MLLINIYLLYMATTCNSLKILAIMPHIGKSHQLVFEPLFKKLVSIGHQVTLVTRFPLMYESSNWRDVNIAVKEKNETELFNFDLLTGTRLDKYGLMIVLGGMAYKTCSEGLSHKNLKNFLAEDQHFDVVLIEIFNTNCFMGVAKKYNAPIIGIHSASWMPWTYKWFGIPYHPGYFPNHFLGLPIPMNFIQRLENTVNHLYTNLFYDYVVAWLDNSLSKQYTGFDLFENGDVMNNISLLLINSHFTLNLPIPLSPNVIEVAGIHLDAQPIRKLPQNLDKFINESTHGVIYVSMGSTIRGDSFPEAKRNIFLKVFGRFPQRIIWKWESEMPNKPDNVFTSRWTPQRDILCHPNVKVFITHSGILGTIEGVDCGKPMLFLPQFGDQFTNAMSAEKSGAGLTLNLNLINEEILEETLNTLLSQEFAEKAQVLSRRFKDRPLSPMKTALYWINYIVENKGASFIKSTAVDMPFYQYLLLDVIFVLLLFLFINVYIFYRSCKVVLRMFSSTKNKIKRS